MTKEQRARLRWRARRGLVENDLFLQRFFKIHEESLTEQDEIGLDALFDLPDNDLLDLFLQRTQPSEALKALHVEAVLLKITTSPQ